MNRHRQGYERRLSRRGHLNRVVKDAESESVRARRDARHFRRRTVCAREGEGQGGLSGAWDVSGEGEAQVKKGDLMLPQGFVSSVMESGVLFSKSREASCGPVLVLKWPQSPGALSPFLPVACPDPRLLKLQPSCSGLGQPNPVSTLWVSLCLFQISPSSSSRAFPPVCDQNHLFHH